MLLLDLGSKGKVDTENRVEGKVDEGFEITLSEHLAVYYEHIIMRKRNPIILMRLEAGIRLAHKVRSVVC